MDLLLPLPAPKCLCACTERTILCTWHAPLACSSAEAFGLRRDQICMVGDRLDTDVLFGKQGGLATMLVLSGVTTEEDLLGPNNTIYPDLYADSLPALLEVQEAAPVAA